MTQPACIKNCFIALHESLAPKIMFKTFLMTWTKNKFLATVSYNVVSEHDQHMPNVEIFEIFLQTKNSNRRLLKINLKVTSQSTRNQNQWRNLNSSNFKSVYENCRMRLVWEEWSRVPSCIEGSWVLEHTRSVTSLLSLNGVLLNSISASDAGTLVKNLVDFLKNQDGKHHMYLELINWHKYYADT